MGNLTSNIFSCKKKKTSNQKPKVEVITKTRGLSINYSNINVTDKSHLTEYQKGVLENATYKGTEPFTIKDTKGWAKVVKVYDGDTSHIAFYHKDELVRLKCRVIKIDTAEIRSDDPNEKEFAYKARNRFAELCEGKLVWVHILKEDLYGRFLTGFYTDETEEFALHQILLDEGFAYKYNGGKKIPFDEWCKV